MIKVYLPAGRTGLWSVSGMDEIQKQRIVVKVGTSTLTHSTGRLNLHNMERLARTLSDLEGMGHEIILVSSGAIGVGTAKMGL